MKEDKELSEELKKGKQIAELLAEHLENMGAKNCSIPIEINSGCYIIEIRKTL